MNFLQLCQRTASECSVSLTGPSDTTTQTGRLLQIVRWVNAAWMELQTKHDDWLFMRFGFTLATTSGDGEYAYSDATDAGTGSAIAAFRKWCGETDKSWDTPMKIYLTSAGIGTQTELVYLPYGDWDRIYNTGTQNNSYPRHWSRKPDGKLVLGPKPDGIYTVTGEFMRAATELSGDSDTPELPTEFHMAIVYGAMEKYGRYSAAPEVLADGERNRRRMLREMSRTQRPPHEVGAELA